jgi:hypothetical protein
MELDERIEQSFQSAQRTGVPRNGVTDGTVTDACAGRSLTWRCRQLPPEGRIGVAVPRIPYACQIRSEWKY